MTKQNVTKLLACALIALGGMSLARPAQAAELFNCRESHAEAVESGAAMCGELGYDYATVTTYCTDGTATSSKVTCHN